MAKHGRREHEQREVTGIATAPPVSRGAEQLLCLVVRSTADGFAVGRALIDANAVQWVTPSHARPWLETRPVDVVVSAEKWANEDGTVTLKPKRVNKGSPTLTTVGTHVVFGEAFDSAAHRAKGELKKMFDAALRSRRATWRHLCPEQKAVDLPVWVGTPVGEACAHCGKAERKASAA